MKLHDDHELVTTGPYAIVRHPMYVAFILLHLSLTLITGNYLVGLSGIIMAVIVNTRKVAVEEAMLEERFQGEYREYRDRVGKYFPKPRISRDA